MRGRNRDALRGDAADAAVAIRAHRRERERSDRDVDHRDHRERGRQTPPAPATQHQQEGEGERDPEPRVAANGGHPARAQRERGDGCDAEARPSLREQEHERQERQRTPRRDPVHVEEADRHHEEDEHQRRRRGGEQRAGEPVEDGRIQRRRERHQRHVQVAEHHERIADAEQAGERRHVHELALVAAFGDAEVAPGAPGGAVMATHEQRTTVAQNRHRRLQVFATAAGRVPHAGSDREQHEPGEQSGHQPPRHERSRPTPAHAPGSEARGWSAGSRFDAWFGGHVESVRLSPQDLADPRGTPLQVQEFR